MLEFLRDYFVYFWNLLFRRTTPPSGALTTTEAEKKPAEAKPEKEPIAKPESVKADTTPKEPVKTDTSSVKTVKPPPQSSGEPEKKTPELPAVQTKPTQIPQPISRPTPVTELDEHVLKSSSKVDKPAEKKKDSFIEFEKLQQSRVQEAQAAPSSTDEPTEEYQIEDDEIQNIVEDILNCEEDLPEEESEKYADDDLQKKIREHLKALQEQDNQFQYQTPSQILKSAESAASQAQQKASTQLKFASEEFENHAEDEE